MKLGADTERLLVVWLGAFPLTNHQLDEYRFRDVVVAHWKDGGHVDQADELLDCIDERLQQDDKSLPDPERARLREWYTGTIDCLSYIEDRQLIVRRDNT